MKKRLIIMALASLVIVAIMLIFRWINTTTLIISVPNAQKGDITYTVINQKTQKQIQVKTSSKSFTKTIPNGPYEVTVSQSATSYFAIIESKGIHSQIQVNATLASEKARSFVGNNPGPCVNLLGSVLYTSDCYSQATARVHTPATASQPTFIDTDRSPFGYLESTTATKLGNLALFSSTASDMGHGIAQTVYKYNMNGTTMQPIDQAVLADLDPDTDYTLQPYQNGFLVYDRPYVQVFYYSSLHAQPQRLKIVRPTAPGLSASSISSDNDGALAATFNETPGDFGDSSSKIKTDIVLIHGNRTQHIQLPTSYAAALFCGQSMLCLFDRQASRVEVNELHDGKLKQVYVLNNVRDISPSSSGLLAVRSDGVLNLDTGSRTGSYEYKFGDYQYNGLQPGGNGFVLRLTDTKNNKIALYVDSTQKYTGSIDQQVSELTKMIQVSSVSTYGNQIFITPIGTTIYDPALRSFTTDPSVQRVMTQKINAKIDSLGINRKVYNITITSPDTR